VISRIFISKVCKTKNKNCHQLVVVMNWWLLQTTQQKCISGFVFFKLKFHGLKKSNLGFENPSRIKQDERAINLRLRCINFGIYDLNKIIISPVPYVNSFLLMFNQDIYRHIFFFGIFSLKNYYFYLSSNFYIFERTTLIFLTARKLSACIQYG
jgi:hypothetical protein